MRKGILMAGGNGSRLLPLTRSISKHLLPVYDKPMIFYPLSVLKLAGIRDVLVIAKPEDIPIYQSLLFDASDFGLNLTFAEQEEPRGIADAFTIGQDFLSGDPCALILGDNLFFGKGFGHLLREVNHSVDQNFLFSIPSSNPQDYGVIELDANGTIMSIEEKPIKPKSKEVITGLYFFDDDVCKLARSLKPSKRGELEITDLLLSYSDKNKLRCVQLGRGFLWMDMGNHANLLEAGFIVKTFQERLGVIIGDYHIG